MQYLLTVTLILTVLSGCSTAYVVPDKGPIAKIRFVSNKTNGIGNVNVHIIDDQNCKKKTLVASLSGIAISHGRKTIGLPLGEEIDNKHKTETVIKANQNIIFDFSWLVGSIYTGFNSCSITTSFRVEKNKIYEAAYSLDRENCYATVNEIKTELPNKYVRVPVPNVEKTPVQCDW